MDHQYALSFEPEGGGHVVPADAYTSALQATLDALVSARNAAAPIIAAGRAWPVVQVREGLELGIAPTEPGTALDDDRGPERSQPTRRTLLPSRRSCRPSCERC